MWKKIIGVSCCKVKFMGKSFVFSDISLTFGAVNQTPEDMSAAFTLSTAIKFAEHLALAGGLDIAEDFPCP